MDEHDRSKTGCFSNLRPVDANAFDDCEVVPYLRHGFGDGFRTIPPRHTIRSADELWPPSEVPAPGAPKSGMGRRSLPGQVARLGLWQKAMPLRSRELRLGNCRELRLGNCRSPIPGVQLQESNCRSLSQEVGATAPKQEGPV